MKIFNYLYLLVSWFISLTGVIVVLLLALLSKAIKFNLIQEFDFNADELDIDILINEEDGDLDGTLIKDDEHIVQKAPERSRCSVVIDAFNSLVTVLISCKV